MAGRRRGGFGVGAVQQKKETTAKFQAKGNELAGEQLEHFSQQLGVFTVKLEEFAHRHRDEIRKNPQFRRHFQIVEVCMATNHQNGGIMTLDELRNRLVKSRSRSRKEPISNDDVLRAVEKLKVLGNGFELIPLGTGRFLVQSVPGELSMDHSRVLQLAEDTGFVTQELIMDRLRWDERRASATLDHLVKQGIAWIDDQAPDTRHYWLPSLFLQLRNNPSPSTSVSDSVASLSAC